jgi:magnesium chelatase subunit D
VGQRQETPAAASVDQDINPPAVHVTVPPDWLTVQDRRFVHPWHGGRGKHSSAGTFTRGRYIRAVAQAPAGSRIAFDASVRAAAPLQGLRPHSGKPAIQITAGDLRFKQFKQRAALLVTFAVDASGSMAANRFGHVKGAVIDLLQKAYMGRVKVAVVSFRGNGADVVLPPTRSVVVAKRAVQALPAGGGTPLAAGLAAVLRLAQSSASVRQPGGSLLVLLTDGRANVLREDHSGSRSAHDAVWRELQQVCTAIRDRDIASIVIDTSNRVLSGGEAEGVANLLSARYVRFPNLDAHRISAAVTGELMAMRRDGRL